MSYVIPRLRVSFGGGSGGRCGCRVLFRDFVCLLGGGDGGCRECRGCRVLFRDFVCQIGVQVVVQVFLQALMPVLGALPVSARGAA